MQSPPWHLLTCLVMGNSHVGSSANSDDARACKESSISPSQIRLYHEQVEDQIRSGHNLFSVNSLQAQPETRPPGRTSCRLEILASYTAGRLEITRQLLRVHRDLHVLRSEPLVRSW